jgi:Zn-dependent protease with chaperone function
MTTSGRGSYFDGVTTTQHDVTVTLTTAAVRIMATDGRLLAEWPYSEIETLSAPDGVLRLGWTRNAKLARLEIRDPQLAGAIDAMAITVDHSGKAARRSRTKVVVWTVAAMASLFVLAVFLVPEIATRLAPLVPYAVERHVGDALDPQIRDMLDTRHVGAGFECGRGAGEEAGRAAFEKMIAKLEQSGALPFTLRAAVVRRSDANAITLPGGYIYVFQGLIEQSKTPDELAGVIAHEFGHVAHRDGTRSVLQGAGLSFLFGMLLGDFVGGGAVILAARVLLQSNYSRGVEASADAYSVALMQMVGGDPRALGRILSRIDGSTHSVPKILLDHPDTQSRVTAIDALAGNGSPRALISDEEWAALRRICSST